MKRIGVLVVMLVVLLPFTSFAWIGEERLREIDERILETESKLLQLDEQQISNRTDWTDWGIAILAQDIKEMEMEIANRRERWEELKKKKMTSQEAWEEWEKVGRELDELERKKSRLDSTLNRLKLLRDKLKTRYQELKEPPKPPVPLKFGVGLGVINSSFALELKVVSPPACLFIAFGGIRERPRYWWEEESYEAILSYFGAEFALLQSGGFSLSVGGLYLVPTGGEFKPFVGVSLEGSGYFLEARVAPSSTVVVTAGVIFGKK